jgi:hypothetical protein
LRRMTDDDKAPATGITAPPDDVSVDPKGDHSADLVPPPTPKRRPLLPAESDDTRDADRAPHEQRRTPSDRRRP